jgi:hypothetical protein
MAHSFSISVVGNADEMFEKAKKAIVANGGEVTGTAASGSFSGGGVVGAYQVVGAEIKINLSKGPFYASWSMIEQKIRGFFE